MQSSSVCKDTGIIIFLLLVIRCLWEIQTRQGKVYIGKSSFIWCIHIFSYCVWVLQRIRIIRYCHLLGIRPTYNMVSQGTKMLTWRLEHNDVEIFFWFTWAMFPTHTHTQPSVSYLFGKVVLCVILTYRKSQCLTWPANTKWTRHGFFGLAFNVNGFMSKQIGML